MATVLLGLVQYQAYSKKMGALQSLTDVKTRLRTSPKPPSQLSVRRVLGGEEPFFSVLIRGGSPPVAARLLRYSKRGDGSIRAQVDYYRVSIFLFRRKFAGLLLNNWATVPDLSRPYFLT